MESGYQVQIWNENQLIGFRMFPVEEKAQDFIEDLEYFYLKHQRVPPVLRLYDPHGQELEIL